MPLITTASMVTQAKERADMPVAGFISDAQVLTWVNEGLKTLHKLLVDAYENGYAYKEETATTDGGSDYALPTDFYRLYGLDLVDGTSTITLQPYQRSERNVYRNAPFGMDRVYRPRVRYDFISFVSSGNTVRGVRLLPTPQSGLSLRFIYAPMLPDFSDSQSVDIPDGWEKYAVVYAAVQMLMKEESPVRELQGLLAKWEGELKDLKDTRDSAFPKSVTDAEALDVENLYPW